MISNERKIAHLSDVEEMKYSQTILERIKITKQLSNVSEESVEQINQDINKYLKQNTNDINYFIGILAYFLQIREKKEKLNSKNYSKYNFGIAPIFTIIC